MTNMTNIRPVNLNGEVSQNNVRASSISGDHVSGAMPQAQGPYRLPRAQASGSIRHMQEKQYFASAANHNIQVQNQRRHSEAAKKQADDVKKHIDSNTNGIKQNSGQSPNGPKNKKKSGNSYLALYILAGIALAMLVYASLEFFYKPNKEQDIKPSETIESVVKGIEKNIYFAGINMENLDFPEFEQKIAEKNNELGKTELKLKNDQTDQKPTVTLADLSYQYDSKAIYQNAIKLSEIIRATDKEDNEKTGFFIKFVHAESSMPDQKSIENLAKIEGEKFELVPVYEVNEQTFENAIDKIAQEFGGDRDEQQKITFNVQTLKFEAENSGNQYILEKEDLITQIKNNIKNNTLDKEIRLKFKENDKILTTEEIEQKLGYISSGYTPFVTYDPPRDANVNRVAELLTGLVIQPGEVFSYLDYISPVTPENGYQQGYQIGSDGQPELTYGGGICQGSSTLYNAVVRADLEIVERNNHTVPSLYITQGMDAMVSDWSDFRFRNNTDYPIAIVGTCVATEYIQFDLYGRKLEEGVTIDLDPHYIGDEQPGAPKRVPNKDLAPGEEITKTPAIVGSHWSTDKVYYKDGVEFKREFLNNSYYWPYAAVIEYGPSDGTTKSTESSATTAPPATQAPPTETTSEATTTPTTAAPPTTEPPTTPPETTPIPEETPSP